MTHKIVQEAMKIVSHLVRMPKCVRMGLVKINKKNKNNDKI